MMAWCVVWSDVDLKEEVSSKRTDQALLIPKVLFQLWTGTAAKFDACQHCHFTAANKISFNTGPKKVGKQVRIQLFHHPPTQTTRHIVQMYGVNITQTQMCCVAMLERIIQ